MEFKKIIILLAFAFVGWFLCAMVMGIGMEITSVNNALIIHAIAAPIIFGFISWIYFKKISFTTALQTATIFVFFVILMDFFVVALLIQRSFEMFTSILGTWIPFILIFASTYLVGTYLKRK